MSEMMARVGRRSIVQAAGAAALGALFRITEQPASAQLLRTGGVNRNSAPSQLKITDMRAIREAGKETSHEEGCG